MAEASYKQRRNQLETFFDETALDAWSKLTSDAPVSRIRQTVREGRNLMRSTFMNWLPSDLKGKRILDAGCGTGSLAVELALRGASVVAVDISPNLIDIARSRAPSFVGTSGVEFHAGDFIDPEFGQFDYIVALDSLIHYSLHQVLDILAGFQDRTNQSVIFTFAPRTPALAVMHGAGKLFPKQDRAPRIAPISETELRDNLTTRAEFEDWEVMRTVRISRGFYKSQAMELSN